MDQTTHEVMLANWKTVIQRCLDRPKGQSAKQWLSENDISEKQDYYWLRKLRKQAMPEIKPLLPAAAEQHQDIALVEIPMEKFCSPDVMPAITIKSKVMNIPVRRSRHSGKLETVNPKQGTATPI